MQGVFSPSIKIVTGFSSPVPDNNEFLQINITKKYTTMYIC